MTTQPRARRAFWGDIRFLIGIALVILSVAGVWLIVSSARQTTPVLQADRTIAQGEALVSDDFRVVEVSLGTVVDGYLAPQDLEPGMIAARTLAAGELLPVTAASDAQSGRTTSIVIESSVGIPESVVVGTPVELWYAPLVAESDEFDAPRILVADVVVASIPDTDGMLAQRTAMLEIVIDRSDVADVLAAITGGGALSVVPLGYAS
ncbi:MULTISPECIES: SAF domain-containing protein [Microbacterium]|uniref:SAF domain-containing protein n=1 Tax=Microbacterium profundi TaxID=450380 RepID=A0ABV3LKE2_9MICO|nr:MULTISPECIES: SAF domain-containing protein [Microbacterium]MCE7480370.1 SAF domain-containing protein [Microbacterium profundi]